MKNSIKNEQYVTATCWHTIAAVAKNILNKDIYGETGKLFE